MRCCAQRCEAGRALRRGTVGDSVVYFETGQGPRYRTTLITVSISRPAKRVPTRARAFDPLLVNCVVGLIGREYLYDGKEIIRAGLAVQISAWPAAPGCFPILPPV